MAADEHCSVAEHVFDDAESLFQPPFRPPARRRANDSGALAEYTGECVPLIPGKSSRVSSEYNCDQLQV